jgi:type I restriction enzyme S subunit
LVSQSQMKLTVNREAADPLFFYYVFNSEAQQDYIRQNAIQTGVPHTNLGILRMTPVPLPPLAVQQAIAHILGTLDDKIELNRKMNETMEAMARATFKSWFIDFDPVRAKVEGRNPDGMDTVTAALFPDTFEESELGKIPIGWQVVPIGEAVRVVGGGTPSTSCLEYWDGGAIWWATPKDLSPLTSPVLLTTERKITPAGLAKVSSGLLPAGTVLLSSRAPIGYLAVSEVPLAVNQGFIAMVCDGPLPNHYVRLWTDFNMDVIKGRANGTTFQEVSKANFRTLSVMVPSQCILDAFVRQVEVLHNATATNLRAKATLVGLRDSLLPKLLSGEIRVQEAEKQLEAVL